MNGPPTAHLETNLQTNLEISPQLNLPPVHVIGIGLDGLAGLSSALQQRIATASALAGSPRLLGYIPSEHPAQRFVLQDLQADLQALYQYWSATANQSQTLESPTPLAQIVVLVTGDPLFFGLGRLLLQQFPAECLVFHPHVSAIQLAFSRIKVPWQDAELISAHGRNFEALTQALLKGTPKIAVLTDAQHSPLAIAQLLVRLGLETLYQLWVCEDLGAPTERVQPWQLAQLQTAQQFGTPIASLNVVVLLAVSGEKIMPQTLPLFGLPDHLFLNFADRPGLMTKREVRVLALAELDLPPSCPGTEPILWDIGAGTGSVAIEMARLLPQAQVYAIEKTALGANLIHQNCQRFQVENVTVVSGPAPAALTSLPSPNRIFIGGSGGNLTEILTVCQQRLHPQGVVVIALATLEHLNLALTWANTHHWDIHLLQVQLARSMAIAALTRWAPLNPVTLVRLQAGQA
jgi:precorrin-6B C5,15-methyltransferase / cobalt-precorrin-6B C5,C15-methyltransferase